MARVLNFLIVDDDAGQVEMIQALLGQLNLQHGCYYAPDGPNALDFLKHKPPFENVPRPDLILLDLNMPGMSGSEVLHQVKSDPELRSIPVIMVSGSLTSHDVQACYKEHANAFISKPPDMESTLTLLRHMHRFWADTALLPR